MQVLVVFGSVKHRIFLFYAFHFHGKIFEKIKSDLTSIRLRLIHTRVKISKIKCMSFTHISDAFSYWCIYLYCYATVFQFISSKVIRMILKQYLEKNVENLANKVTKLIKSIFASKVFIFNKNNWQKSILIKDEKSRVGKLHIFLQKPMVSGFFWV